MNLILIIHRGVKKYLKRIPKSDAKRITFAIKEFIFNPYAGDIEKVEGEVSTWRRRVGVYRIIYEVNLAKKIIIILKVKRRTTGTYKK